MNVTKERIRSGVATYLENDVVKVIRDKSVMMAAAVLAKLIRSDDAIVDRLMSNSTIALFIAPEPDGSYNLDKLFDAAIETVNTYGNFELQIPLLKNPFVFNADDFRRLKAYIEGDGLNA